MDRADTVGGLVSQGSFLYVELVCVRLTVESSLTEVYEARVGREYA